MQRAHPAILLLSIVSIVLAACGGRHVDSTGFADDLASSYCAYLHRCGVVQDADACRTDTLARQRGEIDYVRRQIAAGALRFDAAGAQACIDAYDAASCSENERAQRLAPEGDAAGCAGAYHGDLPGQATCMMGSECASGRCYQGCSFGCCAGQCDSAPPPTRGPVGTACTNHEVCDEGLFCDEQHVCAERRREGAPCVYITACADGLLCFGDSDTTRACRKPVAPGGACQPGENNGDFYAPSCGAINEVCDASTCVAAAGLGEPCGPARCKFNLVCDASTRTCQPAPKLGEPCLDRCDGDLFCSGAMGNTPGTCKAPLADGGACMSDRECASTKCMHGACAPYGPCT